MDDHTPGRVSQTSEIYTTKRAGNGCSRLCHCLMVFPLLAVAVLGSVSLAFFVVKQNEIITANSNYHCILYATYQKEPIPSIGLRDVIGCNIAIWGEASLILLGVILLVWMIIKAVAGIRVLSCLVFIDLFGVGLGFIGSLSFALNITFGLAQTCSVLGQYNKESESCGNLNLPSKNTKFYDALQTSEVTAWLAAGVLFLMFVLYILLTITFCCRRALRTEGPEYSSFHDVAAVRRSKKNPFTNYGTTETAGEPATKTTNTAGEPATKSANPFNDS